MISPSQRLGTFVNKVLMQCAVAGTAAYLLFHNASLLDVPMVLAFPSLLTTLSAFGAVVRCW